MNIQQAWAHGRQQLANSPTPELDARLLLEHILQRPHSFLLAHGDHLLTETQEEAYLALLKRARQWEPIPYIIGRASFGGLAFIVSPEVLIPRPETEQLVEVAVAWAKARPSLRLADVGTGSGCVAVCLARQLPGAQVAAVDISLPALEIARMNAQRLVPGRIQFHQGHLLNPMPSRLDLIVANLPYVTDHEWTMLDDGVKLYEPAIALRGGDDGLDLIRQLLQQARSKLNSGGAIFLEIGWQQGPAAQQIAEAHFSAANIELLADFAGHHRIVAIKTGLSEN